ncbi:Homocysteine S-methyltransferase [Pilaira anomala]|nr:Homocysteine S-methyltransferase [Pilaira anomala]
MYYEAGANIATTCSYQASFEGFAEAGYSTEESIELMKKSVSLACEARDQYKQSHPDDPYPRLVALSMGCYGAILADGSEYTGNYGQNISLETLVDFHRKRLCTFLLDHHQKNEVVVDLVLFETIPNFLEAQAIAKLVMEWDDPLLLPAPAAPAPPPLPPVAVCFQCKSSDQIADGTSFQTALDIFHSSIENVFGLGFNCTKPKFVESLLKTTYHHTQTHNKVLVAYPDGGEEWDALARTWDESAKLPEEAFGCMMAQSVQAYGPRVIVGGCCGTGPSHIKNIRSFFSLVK